MKFAFSWEVFVFYLATAKCFTAQEAKLLLAAQTLYVVISAELYTNSFTSRTVDFDRHFSRKFPFSHVPQFLWFRDIPCATSWHLKEVKLNSFRPIKWQFFIMCIRTARYEHTGMCIIYRVCRKLKWHIFKDNLLHIFGPFQVNSFGVTWPIPVKECSF